MLVIEYDSSKEAKAAGIVKKSGKITQACGQFTYISRLWHIVESMCHNRLKIEKPVISCGNPG